MHIIVWILMWAVIIGTVGFLLVREKRSGRHEPDEIDRLKHDAVREAEMNRDGRGPNGPDSLYNG